MRGNNDVSATARLSNVGRYTVFEFGGTRLRFIAPAPLERYVRVLEWDRGYLVVEAKYTMYDEPIEEYIGLGSKSSESHGPTHACPPSVPRARLPYLTVRLIYRT